MALTDGAGRLSMDWLRRKAGQPHDWPNSPKKRSRDAIYSQSRRIHGQGGLTRGSYTLSYLIDSTGYSRTHILRAQIALSQQWRRLTPNGSWLITEDQTEEIIDWLKTDHWSKAKRLDGCLWCSTDTAPMHALGLCRRDYVRYRATCRRLGLPIRPKDQVALVMAIGCPVKMLERIERGIALDAEHLDEIAAFDDSGHTRQSIIEEKPPCDI